MVSHGDARFDFTAANYHSKPRDYAVDCSVAASEYVHRELLARYVLLHNQHLAESGDVSSEFLVVVYHPGSH